MIQDRKLTNDVEQAIDNISKNREKYMASVSAALNRAGAEPGTISKMLNEITEHEQMIIKHVRDLHDQKQFQ